MTAPVAVKPLFVRWIKLSVTDADSNVHAFECAVTQAGLTSTGGDAVSINTLCPEGSFSEATERTWQLTVTGVQDVESADSFQLFLLTHDGELATFEFYPKVDKAGVPQGRGFTGTVTLTPPDNVGNAASGTYATFTATLPLQGKYTMLGSKAAAAPGDHFVDDTITASDTTNAAKLGPAGYVASPTAAWTGGQAITFNTEAYPFHWDATAWAAGAAP